MYFERDVGGEVQLVYIDHVYGYGNLYMVASSNRGKLIIEEGYDHWRDDDVVRAFQSAYGLKRVRRSA